MVAVRCAGVTVAFAFRRFFMDGFDIFAIVLVLLVVFKLFAGVKTVPQ